MKERRVVCAANKFIFTMPDKRVEELIVCGARHYDHVMGSQIAKIDHDYWKNKSSVTQGFIDQRGVFMDRREAFVVASNANQVIKKSGNPNSLELFSEDIY